MPDHRAATWLLVFALPVWAVGLYHSMVEREKLIVPRAARQWHARYAKLEPHLAGVSRIAMVLDPKERGKGKARLFRAQYVLAPTVIRLWPKLPEIRHRRLSFIYDFKDQQAWTRFWPQPRCRRSRAGSI